MHRCVFNVWESVIGPACSLIVRHLHIYVPPCFIATMRETINYQIHKNINYN